MRLILFIILFCLISSAGITPVAGQQPEQQPTVTVSREEFEAMKARLEQLEREVQELKKAAGGAPAEPREAEELKEEPGYEAPPEPQAAERVRLQLPDISIVTDIRGNWTNDRGDPNRKKLLLNEGELALQSYLYPDIRGDIFLATHRVGDEFDTDLEEGYISFLDIGKNFSLVAGRKFVGFGKINPLHVHQRPYADLPMVIANFFGQQLVGDGAVLSYLAPTRTFLQFDAGSWHVVPHLEAAPGEDAAEPATLGFTNTINTARVWTSHALSEASELELGLSHAGGSGLRGHGLDLTYKRWPSAYKRLTLQAEYLRGKNKNTGADIDGFYLLANQRLDKYWDVGLRYDWAQHLEPAGGHGSALVGIVTRRLTETTYLRLQYKHGSHPDGGTLREPLLQINFGMGPHAHSLE